MKMYWVITLHAYIFCLHIQFLHFEKTKAPVTTEVPKRPPLPK